MVKKLVMTTLVTAIALALAAPVAQARVPSAWEDGVGGNGRCLTKGQCK
jgi:hypothetical protein